ncbi:MAG TPA: hypothetical protein VFF64_24375 [Candidatus Eremiobacteraceae bacterium]|nr:hypothetical protein [Candidatus Eremiobacteraceae bacterium]
MKCAKHKGDPTLAAIRRAGITPTLEKWLEWNWVTDVYDAELLEVLPVEFREEYEDWLRLNSEYERKFAELNV